MKNPHRSAIGFLLFAALGIGCASAEERPKTTGDDWLAVRAQSRARPGDTLEEVSGKLQRLFRAADFDGGGVSEHDYELARQVKAAQLRARRITHWLGRDLDGDGTVTRAELEVVFSHQARQPIRSHGVQLIPTDEQITQTLDKLVGDALASDGNRDGTITYAEALAHAAEHAQKRSRPSRQPRRSILLTLDADGDGTVAEGEFIAAVDRVLAGIDANRDGTLSSEEIAAHARKAAEIKKAMAAENRARYFEEKNRDLVRSCDLPKAPDGTKIVLLGGYRGQALSTVSLGGDDVAVTVANAWIEPGREPLYILLAVHDAVIWRFYGAVDRVVHLAASSHKRDANGIPRVGIVGLPAERVHIPKRADCLRSFTKPQSAPTSWTAKLLPSLIGRGADVIAARHDISTVNVPTGIFELTPAYANTVALPQNGPGAPLWKEMMRFSPGGLVQINAAEIVTRVRALNYEVLPEEAGLAQLVDRGALRILESSRFVVVKGTRIEVAEGLTIRGTRTQPELVTLPTKFLIVKKIRFPAGLTGAHSVHFVLADGVEKPDGSPGHSKVE